MIPTLALYTVMPLAAAGWAFLYWILGGGFIGAFALFIILKLFGK